MNYNPEQKITTIIANKIIREVETESMFEYGVGGFINGNYRNLSYFDNAKDLTNRFTVFDENNYVIEEKIIDGDDYAELNPINYKKGTYIVNLKDNKTLKKYRD